MLSASPERRPSAEQCLAHPWFKNDRQVLTDLLVVNKRSVSPFKEEYVYEEGKSDFQSFMVAPNYYNKQEGLGQVRRKTDNHKINDTLLAQSNICKP